jgi:hypothetical protein
VLSVNHAMEDLRQAGLFEDNASLPHGLRYLTDFITRAQGEELLAALARLPFREARFQGYVAKRRVAHFGVEREDGYDGKGSPIRLLHLYSSRCGRKLPTGSPSTAPPLSMFLPANIERAPPSDGIGTSRPMASWSDSRSRAGGKCASDPWVVQHRLGKACRSSSCRARST